jgi:hypothetical protein
MSRSLPALSPAKTYTCGAPNGPELAPKYQLDHASNPGKREPASRSLGRFYEGKGLISSSSSWIFELAVFLPYSIATVFEDLHSSVALWIASRFAGYLAFFGQEACLRTATEVSR